jgi:anti-sigma B factor antagonist
LAIAGTAKIAGRMITPTPFEIKADTTGSAATLTVVGELDIATVPELRAQAQRALDPTVTSLTIDLAGVEFIDSSGLSLLIELNEQAHNDGWSLQLTRPPERAFAVFTITGADGQLPFIGDVSAA